jgi:hypothetical protein
MVCADSSSCRLHSFPFGAHRKDTSAVPGTATAPGFVVIDVLRFDSQTDELSVADYHALFARQDLRVPVAFTGVHAAGEAFDESLWTREALRQECGHHSIYREAVCATDPQLATHWGCHPIRYKDPPLVGKSWAGQEAADVRHYNISPWETFSTSKTHPKAPISTCLMGP